MRSFWDERAREDAFHFVDNREPYRAADPDRFWTEGERDLDVLLDAVGATVAPDDDVLDLGCGLGRLTRVLAARAARVTALDVSPEMLERARSLHPGLDNVTWVLGDGTTFTGVEDASLDAVVSHVVLQHLPTPELQLGYVAEIGRVLRPGGWAAFSLSTDPAIHRPWRRSAREALLTALGRAPRGQHERAWLGSAVDVQELRRTVAAAGLELARLEGAGTQFTLVRVVREAP